jgi:hypothetical protein
MKAETQIRDGAEVVAEELPDKQQKALAALLSEPTLKAAARSAGCSEPTLWRYIQDKTFAKRLRELRLESVAQASARLQNTSGEAVRVLTELMTGAEVPPAVRMASARYVLEMAFRSVELDDLQRRIEELEAFIKRKAEGDELDKAGGEEDER